MATLLLSQGTPMMLMGDEVGRTQHGNNNAYCQDNEIAWLQWQDLGPPRPRLPGIYAPASSQAAALATRCCAQSRFLHGEDDRRRARRHLAARRRAGDGAGRLAQRHQQERRPDAARASRQAAADVRQRLSRGRIVQAAARAQRAAWRLIVDTEHGTIEPRGAAVTDDEDIIVSGRALLLFEGARPVTSFALRELLGRNGARRRRALPPLGAGAGARGAALLPTQEPRFPCCVADDGWFELETDAVGIGDGYCVRARRRHGGARSCGAGADRRCARAVALVDPRAYAWRTADWRGRPWEEAVIYELHTGTFSPEGTLRRRASRSSIISQIARRHRHRADAGRAVRRHARLGL